MAKEKLTFDLGVKEYDINGAVTRFNPTDANFIDRFYEAMERLDEEQRKGRDEVDRRIDDPKAMFEYATERDARMRREIDGIFGEGFADRLFADMNCYAYANGLPVWMNLFFVVADKINEAMEDERAKTDPRMKAYSRKYEGLMRKYKPYTNRQLQKGK